MDNFISWINHSLFPDPNIKAIVVISLCCAVGLALGKIKLKGISLGVTFVFFIGILLGSLGVSIHKDMLTYAEDFGLIIFVYVLGLQVGPGFVSSFRSGGTKLSLLGLGVIFLGTSLIFIPYSLGWNSLGELLGSLCGAATNTPALAAAQQALNEVGRTEEGINAALALALTYPVGMVAVIMALLLIRGFFKRHKSSVPHEDSADRTFAASFEVENPAIFGKTIAQCAHTVDVPFVISRVWRKESAILAKGDTKIEQGDHLLVISHPEALQKLTILFGRLEAKDWNSTNVDWDKLDAHFVSLRVLVTKPEINGRALNEMNLRNRYGVNLSRLDRSGIRLIPTPELRLRIGDRLTVVGERESCERLAQALGNEVKALDTPNMITIFIGMVLGLVLGYLPIALPGMGMPLRLGLAGGPIIAGILIGAYGPRWHMVSYVTTSATLLIRSLGLSTYLACLGLEAGPQFVDTVMRPAALSWIGWSTTIAVVPVVLFGILAIKRYHCSYPTAAGMLCGVMANPIALDYINTQYAGDKASVAYATVYPIGLFMRVILAQLIVMLCLA